MGVEPGSWDLPTDRLVGCRRAGAMSSSSPECRCFHQQHDHNNTGFRTLSRGNQRVSSLRWSSLSRGCQRVSNQWQVLSPSVRQCHPMCQLRPKDHDGQNIAIPLYSCKNHISDESDLVSEMFLKAAHKCKKMIKQYNLGNSHPKTQPMQDFMFFFAALFVSYV